MSYDITLSGSVRANLLALQKTQSAIDTTNTRLNTGKNVNNVIDDAVAYFSSKALTDRANDFNDRKATIDQAISSVNAALTATASVDSLLKQLKGILTAAKSSSAAERGDLQTQFNTVKNQIDQLVADATYQGTNLVNNSVTRLDTQFSERSSSRLVVTAQRLSTYQTDVPANVAALSAVNAVIVLSAAPAAAAAAVVSVGLSGLSLYAGAVGLYYVTGIHATGSMQTANFIRYNVTDASVAGPGRATGSTLTSHPISFQVAFSAEGLGGINSRLTETFIASRDSGPDSGLMFQTQYNAVSGLNVFLASQIFIVVDRGITGSFTLTTVSTGTLWSARDFDPSTGLASDQFNEVMNLVIEGVNAALRQNNGAAKILGTNVAVLNTRLEFTKSYINVQKEGAGKLVLADTNEEGANLISLQTRQQLGIQALAFAGQSEQAVLRLFR